jgi:hypothetical protein
MERRITATHHAVERYIARHDPNISYLEAQNKVLDGLRCGSRLKKKSIQGHTLWKFGGESNVVGVVKQSDRTLVCVTILPNKSKENVGHFDLDNLNYQEELDKLEEVLGPETYLYDLEEYRVSLKEKYALELEKYKTGIGYSFHLKKTKELEQTLETTLEENSDKIKKLKSDIQILQETNDRYRKIIDLSLDVIVGCLSYLVEQNDDPKVQEILDKVNVLDPTIIPYFQASKDNLNIEGC